MKGKSIEVLVEGKRVRVGLEEIIPISKEMQKRRGRKPTRAQEARISDFIAAPETPREREEFAKAFAILLAIEKEKSSPDKTSKSWGSRREFRYRPIVC